MQAGYCFTFVDSSIEPHVWVVISDPTIDEENVLIVNMTTFKPNKDNSCILTRGEHPLVTHKTCIEYKHARLVSSEWAYEQIGNGKIRWQASVSATILKRIRKGASQSPRLAIEFLELLERQNLLD